MRPFLRNWETPKENGGIRISELAELVPLYFQSRKRR